MLASINHPRTVPVCADALHKTGQDTTPSHATIVSAPVAAMQPQYIQVITSFYGFHILIVLTIDFPSALSILLLKATTML